jgi:ABC-2 type transport system ATP-binding protein
MDDRPLSIRVRTDRPKQLASLLIAGPAAVGVRAGSDDSLVVDTDDVSVFRRAIARDARSAGARLYEVSTLDDDLESVFRYLVDPSRSRSPG